MWDALPKDPKLEMFNPKFGVRGSHLRWATSHASCHTLTIAKVPCEAHPHH